MPRRKLYLLVAAGLLLTWGVWYSVRQSSGPVTSSNLADEPDIAAQDVEIVQGSGGEIRWRLRAQKAEYDQTRGVVRVERPQMTSYLGPDRQEVFIMSEQGVVDQGADNMEFSGGVVGKVSDFTLKARSFDFLSETNIITLRGMVELTRPDMVVHAGVVRIDLANRQMVADEGVDAEIIPVVAIAPLPDAQTPGMEEEAKENES